jgi:hypothetical protein
MWQTPLADFGMNNLGVVGKRYQINEKVSGFQNEGDGIKFWSTRVLSRAGAKNSFEKASTT